MWVIAMVVGLRFADSHSSYAGSVANREIFTPITAAQGPEMSADSHLSHTMDNAMPGQNTPGHNMAGMTAPSEPPASHAGIPPASDPKEFARATATNPAPAAPASAVSATMAAGATIRILPGAGNTNATDTYSPQVLTIKRGTTVAWLNTDPGMVHNVGDDRGAFKSTLIREDESWSYAYNKKGVFPYRCLPHPWMKGEVIVK